MEIEEKITSSRDKKLMLTSGILLIGCVVCIVALFLLISGRMDHASATTQEGNINVSVVGEYDGKPYHLITMGNANGMTVEILDFGGTITTLKVPDKAGNTEDITLGLKNLSDYLIPGKTYFGAVIGRYANRLANGMFTIDGTVYNVTLNEGNPPNRQLHGGLTGWNRALFQHHVGPDSVILSHVSKDGDQGYPGEVNVNVTITLTADNELQIHMQATTTKPTPINLTSHPYFNLQGHKKGTIRNHKVAIYADSYLPVDKELIPTGIVEDVSGSIFDLRQMRVLDDVMDNVSNETLGYDHNFCLRGPTGIKLAARVEEPSSGRVMEVYTNQPGLQFYTGNFLNVTDGKYGMTYTQWSGFAMEPQNYPDAPNHRNFPDSILRPGSVYENFISYKFSVIN